MRKKQKNDIGKLYYALFSTSGVTVYRDKACGAGNDLVTGISQTYQDCMVSCEAQATCKASVWTSPDLCQLKTVCEINSMMSQSGAITVRKGEVHSLRRLS